MAARNAPLANLAITGFTAMVIVHAGVIHSLVAKPCPYDLLETIDNSTSMEKWISWFLNELGSDHLTAGSRIFLHAIEKA